MKTEKPLVKVCGMRDSVNILDIASLHPDMMGFIFYPGSKRYVGEDFSLPGKQTDAINKVGVFVDEEPEKVIGLLNRYGLQTAQLHGKESPDECFKIKDAGFKVMKAFGVDENFAWDGLESYKNVTDIFVFDTKTVHHGGSGSKFNWDILKNYHLSHPFLLSGGISPDDVTLLKSFQHKNCLGYDINSGFETAPAMKDVQKVLQFINTIRQA